MPDRPPARRAQSEAPCTPLALAKLHNRCQFVVAEPTPPKGPTVVNLRVQTGVVLATFRPQAHPVAEDAEHQILNVVGNLGEYRSGFDVPYRLAAVAAIYGDPHTSPFVQMYNETRARRRRALKVRPHLSDGLGRDLHLARPKRATRNLGFYRSVFRE